MTRLGLYFMIHTWWIFICRRSTLSTSDRPLNKHQRCCAVSLGPIASKPRYSYGHCYGWVAGKLPPNQAPKKHHWWTPMEAWVLRLIPASTSCLDAARGEFSFKFLLFLLVILPTSDVTYVRGWPPRLSLRRSPAREAAPGRRKLEGWISSKKMVVFHMASATDMMYVGYIFFFIHGDCMGL